MTLKINLNSSYDWIMYKIFLIENSGEQTRDGHHTS